MKRALLAACAAIALATPARAQWAVIDVAKIAQDETHQFQTIAQWGMQAANMAREIQGGVQRLQQLQAAYAAITRVTDLGSAVSALGLLGIRNPLPVNPYALQGLLNGRGGAQGMLGSLTGLYTGTLGTNRVYQTPGATWLDRQINEQGGGIAGAQAVALQLYQSAAERVPLLAELQARINTAEDPSERESLIARFGAEQAYIQNAQVQAQAMGSFMAAQFQLRDQQREERMAQSIDEVLADAEGRGWLAPVGR